MTIALANDHAGVALKEEIKKLLDEKGLGYKDFGTNTTDSVDYPEFGAAAGRAVASGECELGILICGTGIGMSMAANKVAGIRAANVISTEFAELAREHNNANVLCLSGRFVDLLTNEEICDVFLATSFGEGRHAPRVAKIDALD